jgi:hypothetical protein
MDCINCSAFKETSGTSGYPVLPNIHNFKVKVVYDNLGFIKNFAERELKLPSINQKEVQNALNNSQIREQRSRAQSRDSRNVVFNRRPGTKYRSLSPVNEESMFKNEIHRPITRKIGTRAEYGLKL